MQTIIQKLKSGGNADMKNKIEELEGEIDDLRGEVESKDEEIDELKEELSEVPAKIYTTALGRVLVINESGNIQLDEELKDFFELIQQKY